MTINQIYLHYIDSKTNLVTGQTAKTYNSFYDVHIAPLFGNRDIYTVQYIDYQKFSDNLLRSGKKPKTVRNILSVLIGIYKFALKNDWYDGKIYPQMVDLPNYDNKFYVPFSADLQKQYLMAIYNFEELIYRDMFLMLLHGRRLGEVRLLQWEYIDLQQSIVYYPPELNKSRKHRTYRLTDYMTNILKEYHARECDLQSTVFPTGFVFKNPKTGKPFADLKKPWQRLLQSANLPHTKLHSIRHILGTYLINTLGVNILDVSYMLGHSDVSITMKYYTPSPDIARDCTQAVIDSFKSSREVSAEKLSSLVGMGKHIEAVLFSDQELKAVNHYE